MTTITGTNVSNTFIDATKSQSYKDYVAQTDMSAQTTAAGKWKALNYAMRK